MFLDDNRAIKQYLNSVKVILDSDTLGKIKIMQAYHIFLNFKKKYIFLYYNEKKQIASTNIPCLNKQYLP